MTGLVGAALVALLSFNGGWCDDFKITGYVRGTMNPRTADGTSIYTDEWIVAASYDVPMGATVDLGELGVYRVADRGGGLAYRHIDVAVWSYERAYQLTGRHEACIR